MNLFFAQHLYLLSSLYFLLFWIVFYISFRKDKEIQKKILIVSFILMIDTPFVEHINLADWWSPTFILNTFFHIEDLLFGFGITGTTLGIYFWVSRRVRSLINDQAVFSNFYRKIVLIATIFIIFVPFYLFQIPSFYTEIMCIIFLCASVFARIPAMILPSITTGIILMLIILPGYFLGSYLHPGWIQMYWKLSGWPGHLFFTIPIGEYIYYIFTGLFISAFQELFFANRKI